jgi:hypothetical protein
MTMKRMCLGVASTLIATAVGFSVTFAQSDQTTTPNSPAMRHAPAPEQGMMMGGGHMMMGQMTRMMENCNRMMESMQHTPSGPGKTRPRSG